ncbi:MAG: M15 family metallopeptidase [Lachnospiraceae bacterium]|nr:M15 family metallopeptidase [Lachnospiraceae bacterium]
MKMSMEERFRKKLRRIGKKNKLCRFWIIPVMAVGMFFFHALAYLKGNGKRFAMLAVTFLLFVVYSSFSFPMFISGNGESGEWNQISEEAQDIVLAEETEINLEDFELLDDDDVRLDDEDFSYHSHGTDVVTRYSADDILEANPSPAYSDEVSVQTEGNGMFSKDDWRLVLINKQHSVPDDYEVKLGSINTIKGQMHCDERIIGELLAMIQDAKEDDVVLEVCSPYRDLEYQKKLFNRKIVRYMGKGMSYMEAYQLSSEVVTVPGASEHQIGLALDIVTDSYRELNEGFAETAAGKWLAENSYKYGFILRYPLGKEYITGIEYEPWHFRYVGVEAATVITEQGITLEELWDSEEFWEEP